MARELRAASIPESTVYAIIYSRVSRVWNGTTFETYASGNYSTYAVTMTQAGGSGIFIGDFPAGISDTGHYEFFYFIRDGAVPAEGDRIIATGSLDWDGSSVVDASDVIGGALSGADWITYVVRALKRTDKTQEILDATKDCIDEIRRRFRMPEDETQTTVTDTIAALGDYQMDLETDFGTLDNIVFQDGNFGYQLTQITKGMYDRLYAPFGTGASARGRPRQFTIFGEKILVGAVPDSVDYTYKISYTTDAREIITSSTISVPFTNKYREVLRRGVLAKLFSDILKNDEQAAKFGTLFENDMKYVDQRIDRNRTGVVTTRYQGF